MSLIIFNGSPRGRQSNSGLIAESFLNGFKSKNEEETEFFYLSETKNVNRNKEIFSYENSDKIIFVFPLYTDAMPGLVKEFFESLEPKNKKFSDKTKKNIGFIKLILIGICQ